MSELAKMRAVAAAEFDKKFPPPSMELDGDEYDALEEQRKVEFCAWWEGWQAATEAAKDTGTAGELPEPKLKWRHADICGNEIAPFDPFYSADQMREYGQACVKAGYNSRNTEVDALILEKWALEEKIEAARQPASGMASVPSNKLTFGDCHRFGIPVETVRAARQPAPVVAVKTWQERMDEDPALLELGALHQENAELRAALAARSQP